MFKVFLMGAAVAMVAAPAFAQSRSIAVADAWVRVYEGAVTAYFHVLNNGEQPDRLIGVTTPVADKAEIVRMRIRGPRVTTQPLASLEIAGFDDERLRPAGTFVRLTGVNRRLAVGDTVPLALRFERAGTIEVDARVANQLLGNR